VLDRARGVFESTGDAAGLGRAWHVIAAINGSFYLRSSVIEVAIEQLRTLYEEMGFAGGAWRFLSGATAWRGRMPAPAAIDHVNELLSQVGSPAWESFLLMPLAALEAIRGRFDVARSHLAAARERRREFADRGTIVTSWAYTAGLVELLAGEPQQAAVILSEACAALRDTRGEWLPTNEALLAEALYRLDSYDEALAAADGAIAQAPPRHLLSLVVSKRARAKALARLGRLDEAREEIRSLLVLHEGTDELNEQGEAFLAAAEVEALAGGDFEPYVRQARERFDRKGNVVSGDAWRPPIDGRIGKPGQARVTAR
jgi:tetratricopeptide (TPR) repeat protein